MRVKYTTTYKVYPHSERATEYSMLVGKLLNWPTFTIAFLLLVDTKYGALASFAAIAVLGIIRVAANKAIERMAKEDYEQYMLAQIAQAAAEYEKSMRMQKVMEEEQMLHRRRVQEMRTELLQNTDKHDKVQVFLSKAASCKRVSEVMELWQMLRLEQDPMFAEVTEMINKSLNIERVYGVSPNNVTHLIRNIREKTQIQS